MFEGSASRKKEVKSTPRGKEKKKKERRRLNSRVSARKISLSPSYATTVTPETCFFGCLRVNITVSHHGI